MKGNRMSSPLLEPSIGDTAGLPFLGVTLPDYPMRIDGRIRKEMREDDFIVDLVAINLMLDDVRDVPLSPREHLAGMALGRARGWDVEATARRLGIDPDAAGAMLVRHRTLGSVSALPAWRAITALMCRGWTANAIATAVGIRGTNIKRILEARQPSIHAATRDRIMQAYELLVTYGPNEFAYNRHTQSRALGAGYVPPAFYEGIDIADPEPVGEADGIWLARVARREAEGRR